MQEAVRFSLTYRDLDEYSSQCCASLSQMWDERGDVSSPLLKYDNK